MWDWATAERYGLYLDIASAGLFVLLGIAVALVKPRRIVNIGFALFAIGFGAFFAVANLGEPGLGAASGPVLYVPMMIAAAAWVCGAFLIGILYPERLSIGQSPVLRPLLVIFGIYLLAQAVLLPFVIDSDAITFLAGEWLGFSSYWFVLFAAALRHGLPRTPNRTRVLCALVTVALLPFNNLGNGIVLAQSLQEGGAFLLTLMVEAAMTVAFTAVWVRNAVHASGKARRRSRQFAGLSVALFGIGMVFAYATDLGRANNLGLLGASRVFGVSLLAYAIVKHQLFDIDIRLKWTLSRGALVGIFVAVVFVVSQLVQAFAGLVFGLVGGAFVAGLLLFALHPLQRLADGFSDKAMPNVRPEDPKYVIHKKRETYRNAYSAAWADGTLTQKDARLLAEFKDALGLPEKEYAVIEKEWARAAPRAKSKTRAA